MSRAEAEAHPAASRRPVLIAGPTGSGKSDLALRVAERDGGCVINADALQVYACWRILSARPDAEAMARAPHRLYGHVDCRTRYSAGAWLRDMTAVLEDVAAAGLRPVVVGGTGLYFAALTEGLAPIPDIDPEVRAHSDGYLATGNVAAMQDDLKRRDPRTFARIDRNNPMRVQRAWDVLMTTGLGLLDWHARTEPALVDLSHADAVVLNPDVESLDRKLFERLTLMVARGALEECRSALASEIDPASPSMQAIGFKELSDYLSGKADRETAMAKAGLATRRFAKRQRTWFRNRMTGWTRLDPFAGDCLEAVGRDQGG